MNGTSGITGLLITRNAAATVDWALGSLESWVDEIVVVDMQSDDGTQDRVRAHGGRVVDHEQVGYADPARGFGVRQSSNPWVCMIDADEVVTATLSRTLRAVVDRDDADVVRIPRRNHVMGAACQGGPFAPSRDRHLRFFKTFAVTLPASPHVPPSITPGARLRELRVEEGCLEHFAHRDFTDLLSRADRYTSIQAAQDVAEGRVVSTGVALRRAGRQFAGGYVKHRGFRDGWRGLHTSLFMAYYELLRQGKGRQLASVGDTRVVEEIYRVRAEELLAEHGAGS